MKSYKEIAEALKGKQHKIDKNKNGKIDAHDFKLLRKEESELTEATVKTQKYSWGTMKTVHHGADFSIPLHPEHHQAIAKLKDNQEHKFKDETGRHWTAKRMGDDVHFQGANNGGTTKVKHADLKESEDRMARSEKSNKDIVFKNGDEKKEKIDEVAPPGFEGTVKAMKKKKEIDNPYALAWSMYKKGYKSHKKADGTMKEEAEQLTELTHEVGISYDKMGMRAQGKVRVAAKDHDEAKNKALDAMKGREKNIKVHSSRNLASGKETDSVKFNEEVEQIDELSKDTLASYAKKATKDARMTQSIGKDFEASANKSRKPSMKDAAQSLADKYKFKSRSREAGIGKAIDRLAKEEVELDEAMINGREYASHGLMHPDHAARDIHKVTGSTIDFYAHGTGDKVSGKVTKNDGKAVHIKDTSGKTHQFKVQRGLPKQQNEEKKNDVPFDGPYTKTKGETKDKSGAVHTPMSRAKHLAKMAMKKQMKEDIDRLFEAKEKTEYDYEGDMARGQLQSIVNNAQKVHDMLKDNDNLPEWVQSKITLAEDYISTVSNYMMSEIDEQAPVAPVPGMKFKNHAVMVHPETKSRVVINRKNIDNYTSDGYKEVRPGQKLKEDEEVNFSYTELMMMLEYETKGGVYRHTGTYGSEFAKKEREKDEIGFDADKPTTSSTTQKRGRGRPAGSKSGARGPRIK